MAKSKFDTALSSFKQIPQAQTGGNISDKLENKRSRNKAKVDKATAQGSKAYFEGNKKKGERKFNKADK